MNITDTLRIRRHDKWNVVIERFETNTNPFTNEETSKWKVQGFYPTVYIALQRVLDKGMLVDLDEAKTLTAYNNAVKKQHERIEQLINKERLLEINMDLQLENEELQKEIKKLRGAE